MPSFGISLRSGKQPHRWLFGFQRSMPSFRMLVLMSATNSGSRSRISGTKSTRLRGHEIMASLYSSSSWIFETDATDATVIKRISILEII